MIRNVVSKLLINLHYFVSLLKKKTHYCFYVKKKHLILMIKPCRIITILSSLLNFPINQRQRLIKQ